MGTCHVTGKHFSMTKDHMLSVAGARPKKHNGSRAPACIPCDGSSTPARARSGVYLRHSGPTLNRSMGTSASSLPLKSPTASASAGWCVCSAHTTCLPADGQMIRCKAASCVTGRSFSSAAHIYRLQRTHHLLACTRAQQGAEC
jgi:hypothetical protein